MTLSSPQDIRPSSTCTEIRSIADSWFFRSLSLNRHYLSLQRWLTSISEMSERSDNLINVGLGTRIRFIVNTERPWSGAGNPDIQRAVKWNIFRNRHSLV